MDIDRPPRRKGHDRHGDDLAVGDDDLDIGSRGPKPVEDLRIQTDFFRLGDGDPAVEGEPLDRTGKKAPASSDGAVGLGDDERDFVAGFEEGLERGDGRLGTSEKDDAHGGVQGFAAAAFLNFFRIKLRFRGERRSTNSLPSR
ncbi:MAG: hypothetical protein BWX98_01944 [Candidatus Aminicenantes bacterium ADurb.Bin147]|nr:MAG: hypothetical protein BWX98_01944 [Candidatus Aminicenantes bacterium ADurb.Bin147]